MKYNELPILYKTYFYGEEMILNLHIEIGDYTIYPVLPYNRGLAVRSIYSQSEFIKAMDYVIKNDLSFNVTVISREYGNWQNVIAWISYIEIITNGKFEFVLYNGSVKLEYIND